MSQRVLPECGHSSTQTQWLDDTLPDSIHDHKRQTLKNRLVCKIHSAVDGGRKSSAYTETSSPESNVSVCERELVFTVSHTYTHTITFKETLHAYVADVVKKAK